MTNKFPIVILQRMFSFALPVLIALTSASWAQNQKTFEFHAQFDAETRRSSLTVDLYFYPGTEERLQQVVRAFTHSRLQTRIAEEFQKRREGAEKEISWEYSRIRTEKPDTYIYSARFGIPVYKKRTGIECTEKYISSSEWVQQCSAAVHFENTKQFTDDAAQDIRFKIEDGTIHCRFVSTATAKEIAFNLFERAIISIVGIEKLSPTQLTFKGFEASLDQALMTQLYLQSDANTPLGDLVETYFQEGRKGITQMMLEYPTDPSAPRSIDLHYIAD